MTIEFEPIPPQGRSGGSASELPLDIRVTVSAILETMFDPLVVMRAVRDRSGRVIDFEYEEANRAAIAINHTTREELIGARLLTLLPGHRTSGLFDHFVHTVETGESLVLDDVIYANEILHEEGHYDVRAVKVGDAISYTWRDVTDRVVASQRYRLLAENASDVVMMTNPAGVIVWISPSVADVLGWSVESIVGTLSIDLVADEDRETLLEWRALVYRGRDVHGELIRYRTANGDWRWMQLHASPVRDGDGTVAAAVVGLRDCQSEVVAERAFDTLSAASRILVYADDETTMLQAMCQAAVDEGGYAFAWYARVVHDDRRSMSTVTSSKQHADYTDVVQVTWADGPNSDAPMGRVVRTSKTVVVDDLRRDSWTSPWHEVTEQHGFRSVIVVPVTLGGSVDGVLMVYAKEVRAFGANEVILFEDLAHEVEFGISRLRDQAQLTASRRDQNLLTQVIDQAGESILVADTAGLIVYANPAMLRSSGYDADELIGQDLRNLQGGPHDPAYDEEIWATLARGQSWRGSLVNRRKSGDLYEEEATITPITDEFDFVTAYVAVKRDVSAVRTLEAALTREQRDQSTILTIMREVRPGGTLDETAGALARAATDLEHVATVSVMMIAPGGRLRPVGVAGAAMRGIHVGVELESRVSRALLDRAEVGAWWMSIADPPRSMDTAIVRAWSARGFVTAAFVPIRHDREPIGLLLLSSRDPNAPTWHDSRLSTYEQLGSFAGTLVGDQAGFYERTERVRAEIRDVINAHRFRPVFQPFVDLESGAVVGYEALTRFDDGESPERQFIAAHSVGLGPALEASCVVAAIDAASSLPPEIWLSVNFSPAAIIDGTAARVIVGKNRPIVVEITEHAIVEDYGAVRQAIGAMPGVRLAVDDAGAGFTSLTHIIELEPAFVKLDISIVRDIDRDRVRQSMAAAMAYFAAESDATIIAEGVETEAEAATLRSLGATIGGRAMLGQGFLFGHPASFS